MNATVEYQRARAELEAEIGVEPIEMLQAKRRALLVKAAPLRARYGERGTWEARRKLIRYGKMTQVVNTLEAERARLAAASPDKKASARDLKVSEAEAERIASSAPDYLALIDQMEREMAEYILLEDAIESITERINRDQALIRYAANAPR